MELFKLLKKEDAIIVTLFTLSIIFPLSYLFGNLVINIFLFLISITFIFYKIKKKDFSEFYNIDFIILVCLWLTFLINLAFSNNFELSLNRVLKFFFIILFILSFKFLLNYKNSLFESYIFKFWSIIFGVVFFDLIFEFFFGYNISGNVAYMPGRLTSFIKDELVIGYFYIGFALFAFVTMSEKVKYKNAFPLILISLLIVSFLIGERSNFFKFLFSSVIIFLVLVDISYKKKIITFIASFIILIFIMSNNQVYKTRFIDQMPNIFDKSGFKNFIYNSTYGSHYNTAINVFKNNYIFGVGIKNYREESIKNIYVEKNKNFKFQIMGTHPHQIHFEILAETGLFGYLSFLIFILFSLKISIKNYLTNKNKYQFVSILFILGSLIPILPSGSFFSTYTSILFWLNYSIMMAYNKNNY